MKLPWLTLLFVLGLSSTVCAQFSIRNIEPSSISAIARPDSIVPTKITGTSYYDKARLDQERKDRRKQRNTTEFTVSIDLTQSQFDNWAAGGDNTFTARSRLFFIHKYKADKFSAESKIEARYGINRISGVSFKNEDEFKFNFIMSWKIRDAWSYAGTVGFRSQFSDGLKSRTNKTIVSSFMAPGYLDISIGFNYRRDKSPLSITISPIAGQFTFVLDSALSAQGKFGVEKNQRVKKNAGPSLKVDFDKKFGGKEKQLFRLRSYLYCFSNLGSTSQARWENTFEIKATKLLTTTLYGMLYYEEPTKTPLPKKIQSRYNIGLGLSYTIKSKK